MKFTEPAGSNLFDDAKVVGKPTPRIDGPLKVSGRAPYACERHDAVPGQLYGWPVGATIPKGRVTAIHTEAALQAPGVRAVVTTLDMDALPGTQMHAATLFGGAEIQHYHQAIAVVAAETFEQARFAAGLIAAEYDEAPAEDYDLSAAFERLDGTGEPDTLVGDPDAAFAAEDVVSIDQRYTTPSQSHAMMEPHSSVVDWSDGGEMTVWTSNQMIEWNRQALATAFGIEADRIRVESPYLGGGFGAKLFLRSDAVLAAVASRAAKAPVKLALPRPFVMNNTTHRSRTV